MRDRCRHCQTSVACSITDRERAYPTKGYLDDVPKTPLPLNQIWWRNLSAAHGIVKAYLATCLSCSIEAPDWSCLWGWERIWLCGRVSWSIADISPRIMHCISWQLWYFMSSWFALGNSGNGNGQWVSCTMRRKDNKCCGWLNPAVIPVGQLHSPHRLKVVVYAHSGKLSRIPPHVRFHHDASLYLEVPAGSYVTRFNLHCCQMNQSQIPIVCFEVSFYDLVANLHRCHRFNRSQNYLDWLSTIDDRP